MHTESMPQIEHVLHGGLRLRQAGVPDNSVLRDLFLQSRSEAEQILFATHPQGEILLNMQWHARQISYDARFPQRVTWLIETKSGDVIGCLTVNRTQDDVRLVDIALHLNARNQGNGTQLLRWLQADAARIGLPLRLSVAIGSPARRLYDRLGFRPASITEMHTEMTWCP